MNLETTNARRAVNNAYLQETITEADFEAFRQQMLTMLQHADTAVEEKESEEHLKDLIKPFLSRTNFGDEHFVNPKEKQDLAIHNGKTRKSSVGVIIEAKLPSNSSQMITPDNLNRKAFQQAILYYLRERLDNKNEDIKRVIITDLYQWFIFDAQDFERHFYKSKELSAWYREWSEGRKVDSTTKFGYDHIAEFVDQLDKTITATHVDLNRYRKELAKEELSREEQVRLIPIYKLFTPTHLLKLPFASDSNSLNKAFYKELLYILGLKEYKEKGTHYITRLDKDKRHPAALIENTIAQLDSLNVLSRIPNKKSYGKDEEEQLFNVAIQLLITWINRILFLKLLEAQLYKYHRADEKFRFLSHRDLSEYDDLNRLFFQVLAVPEQERRDRIKADYAHIPYLNSSLFDLAEIEQHAIRISELEDGLEMPVYERSKIRDRSGNRLKGASLSALEYLLRFLDAYNFDTVGTATVQSEDKSLINASVLGRIFEKINGYKDGSFFTPGYITEYMCRETIRKAVVQKFNEAYPDWNCETIDEVAGKISRHEVPYEQANAVVNSITICDPAVGSGHFLVSALNELIAIKNDLRIFVDEQYQRIRDVSISVDNDELRVEVGEEPFFEYRVHHTWEQNGTITRTVGADTQRLQKALFKEKNILIENCLFGVDINPNSVNICRLRLWIELLKNAYYREDAEYQSLEVLPNIDINIKQGNSLVSRFDLDADLAHILQNNDELTIEDYKQAVRDYKESGNQAQKRALREKIRSIKESFTVGLEELHPVREKLKEEQAKLIRDEAKLDLFEKDKKSKKQKKQIKKTKKRITKLEAELEELESATFYEQAFEWRFEFPEVLDDEGAFQGFDTVLGNPPYVRQELLKELKPYLKDQYDVYYGTADLYQYFTQQGMEILTEGGHFHYILSNKWMRTNYGKPLREWMQQYQIRHIYDFGDLPVFEEATTYPCLLGITDHQPKQSFRAAEVEHLDFEDLNAYLQDQQFEVDQSLLMDDGWSLVDKEVQQLLEKLMNTGTPLGEYVDGQIYRGVLTGLNEAFVIDEETKEELIEQDPKSAELIKPFLRGRDIKQYEQPVAEEYLIFTRRGVDIDEFPAIREYLSQYREQLEPRPKDVPSSEWEGRKPGSYEWYEVQDTVDYWEEFESHKIIIPAITKEPSCALDLDRNYGNDKTTIVGSDSKYLLGILNSRVTAFIIENISSSKRGGYYEFKPMYLEKLPIMVGNEADQERLKKLVNRRIDEEDSELVQELKQELDELVIQIYNLEENEGDLIER
jgi:adenine-specific DNA-methyltransferase